MDEFDNAAHNMAALTATVALYRALVRKGLMPRDEAMQILLGEAKGNPEIHRRAPLMTHLVSAVCSAGQPQRLFP
jgi:hypothetical protein